MFRWPRPALVSIVALCAYIATSQVLMSFAIEYSDSYIVDVKIPDFDYTDEISSGSSGSNYDYNIWKGVAMLWHDGAKGMAILILLWSGIWPYGKLLMVAYGIWRYRGNVLPSSYEWLSTVAHWSFIDVWMVVVVCSIARFSYDGSSTDTVDSILKIDVSLDMWFQGAARQGVYHFFCAVALSQFLGFCLMKYAQLPGGASMTSLYASCCRSNAESWTLATVVGERYGQGERPLGVLVMLTAAVLAALPLIVSALYGSSSVSSKVVFNLSETVDETYYDIVTVDKTFTFSKTSSHVHSVSSLIFSLLHKLEAGSDNVDLSRIAHVLVLVFPICRSAGVVVLWLAPMPRECHAALHQALEALGIFVNHDVFTLALGVIAWQLPAIFTESMPSSYASDLDLDIELLPGFYYLVIAVLYESMVTAVLMSLHADEMERRRQTTEETHLTTAKGYQGGDSQSAFGTKAALA
jgi:hypothetical protein